MNGTQDYKGHITNSFVYVFSEGDKDALLSKGFQLLKIDTKNNIYVFINNTDMQSALTDIAHVCTNTLTF